MSSRTLTKEEIARRGQELYEQHLRATVEAGNEGKFLVLDLNTGAYEIDDDLTASERLLTRHPDAEIYGVRIGYPTAYRLGGRCTLVLR